MLSGLELQNSRLGIGSRGTESQVGLLHIAAADGGHRVHCALQGESQRHRDGEETPVVSVRLQAQPHRQSRRGEEKGTRGQGAAGEGDTEAK